MTLISEFLFSTKESTNSGSKYFKPPPLPQKQMTPHHVLTLHAMRNSTSLNGKNLRKRFSDIATYMHRHIQ